MLVLYRKQRVPKARALRLATGLNLGKTWRHGQAWLSWLWCLVSPPWLLITSVCFMPCVSFPQRCSTDLGNVLQDGSLSIRHRHCLSRLNLAFSWCVLDDVQRRCVPSRLLTNNISIEAFVRISTSWCLNVLVNPMQQRGGAWFEQGSLVFLKVLTELWSSKKRVKIWWVLWSRPSPWRSSSFCRDETRKGSNKWSSFLRKQWNCKKLWKLCIWGLPSLCVIPIGTCGHLN